LRDETFSLELVMLFAERINLFGFKDTIVKDLRSRDYSHALETCNSAIRTALQSGIQQGLPENVVRASLPFRQLYHLYQMIENFVVCLEPDALNA
jgi:hypothetical protein